MRAGLRLLEHRIREDEEKLTALCRLATEAFDELDRGEAIVVEGEDALTDFVRSIGKRAAKRLKRGAGDE